jgi:hypothetical protein
MQCQQFETVFEQSGDSGLPGEASAHLAECPDCRQLVADFAALRATAQELAVQPEDPPERVWIELLSRLRAEGLIREAREPARRPARELFGWLGRPVLAGAYAALAIAAVALLLTPSPGSTPATKVAFLPDTAVVSRSLDTVEHAAVEKLDPEKSPSDQSFKRSLAVIDNFIALCEKTVHEDPRNEAVREFLYGAYQQKADLLAAAVEHGSAGE